MKYFFKKYNGERVDYDNIDIYGSLAEELMVSRTTAKRAFWTLVMQGSDLRLGAALNDLTLDEIMAEDDLNYQTSGEMVRPIINHYVIERYRLLVQTDAINYDLPVDKLENA